MTGRGNDRFQWCEGYLAALHGVLEAQGSPLDDWLTAKRVIFGVLPGSAQDLGAVVRDLEQIATRDSRFRALVEYIRDPDAGEPAVADAASPVPGFHGLSPKE